MRYVKGLVGRWLAVRLSFVFSYPVALYLAVQDKCLSPATKTEKGFLGHTLVKTLLTTREGAITHRVRG